MVSVVDDVFRITNMPQHLIAELDVLCTLAMARPLDHGTVLAGCKYYIFQRCSTNNSKISYFGSWNFPDGVNNTMG